MPKRNKNRAGGKRAAKAIAAPRARVALFVDGVRVDVSPILEAAVLRARQDASELPAEMTTTQAAEFLDVSRPFVIKLVKRSELPCRMVGKHRRIPTAALLAYREKMFRQARQACDDMTRIAQDAGLYELEGRPAKKP